ncbi:hypothetical protein V491_04002, partial [Pseudogymnoascus sp. VKM F-3775]
MTHTDIASACTSAPRTKRRSAMRMTRLRPRESARRPLMGETRRAKREVDAAIRDLSRVVREREERDVPMEMRAAEITPVSYPNSRPLMPAESVRSQTKR